MSEPVERLYKLVVDGTSAARQLEQISSAAAKTDSAFTKLGTGLKALGAATVASALAGQFRSIISTADAVAQAADRLGVSTNAVQEIGFAFAQSGSDAATAEKALAKLSDGAVRNADAFAKLGIATRDNNGVMKSADALLEGAADAIAKLQNPTERTAAAVKLFGEEGAKLVPLLSEGSAGLRDLRQQAQDTGQVIDAKAVAAAKRLNDDWERLSGTMKVWVTNVAGPAIKVLSDLAAGTAANAAAVRELRAAQLDTQGNKLIDTETGEISLSKITAQMSRLSKYMEDARARIRSEADDDIRSAWESGLKKAAADYAKLDKLLGTLANKLGYAEAPSASGSVVSQLEEQSAKIKELKESLASLNDMTRLGQSLTAEYSTEQERLYEKLGDLQAAHEAGEISWTTYQRGIDATNAALRELTPEYEHYLKLYEDGRALFDSVATNEERHAAELERLQALLAASSIDLETFNRALAKINETYSAPGNAVEKGGELAESLANLAGGTMRDLFRDTDGAGDAMKRFAQRLAEVAVEVLLITPLIQQLQAAVKGSSFMGFLGGVGKAAKDALSVTASPVSAFAMGGVLTGPEMFPGARGLGLAGASLPDAIMPVKRGPDGSPGAAGAGVTVNVINNAGARITTQESQTPGGGPRIDVLVEGVVSSGLQSGKFDSVMGSIFGLRRTGR